MQDENVVGNGNWVSGLKDFPLIQKQSNVKSVFHKTVRLLGKFEHRTVDTIKDPLLLLSHIWWSQ